MINHKTTVGSKIVQRVILMNLVTEKLLQGMYLHTHKELILNLMQIMPEKKKTKNNKNNFILNVLE